MVLGDPKMKAARPPSWQILLAFAIIYFVWGSTFLAIRVGVREVPPFLLAAMRFFAAGLILYVWMRLKSSPSLTLREWAGASFLGTLIFVVDYGCLFWAEQRVPSGIAAVILATILTKRIPLPASKPMSAAAQMLTGGVQLFIVAAISGEMRGFHFDSVSTAAWFSLIYLIFAGSIAGFTAYIWLLHYESPTKVGTYAYVNPVVAVALGHFLGGETVGTRTLLGTLLVLVSVITITTTPVKRKPETETRPVEVGEVA